MNKPNEEKKAPKRGYSLAASDGPEPKNTLSAWKKMGPLLAGEKKGLALAFAMVITSASLSLVGPLVVGRTVDTYVTSGDYAGVLRSVLFLCFVYAGAFLASYVQMRSMGAVAQRTLFKLRNDVFGKLQELPLAFFNANKSGDLIARINADTEKLNQFFSEGLMRFMGNAFMIAGAGVFLLSIDWKVGTVALLPALALYAFSAAMARTLKERNAESLKSSGLLSAEVQESMANFKVILAFGRRDYFKTRFSAVNGRGYAAAIRAGAVNELFTPVFEFAGNVAMLGVLIFGLYMVARGQFALGLLVSFTIYLSRFYDPLREMARLWSTFQVALAAWDRIGKVLHMPSDLPLVAAGGETGKGIMEFRNVSFAYPDGREVLHDISFTFEKGKTYALVGPTGGGKTTTASLIARLYDPTEGTVFLDGKDIRSYPASKRARKVGFILQDPFLFPGTVRENLLYGNADLAPEAIESHLASSGLMPLLSKFGKGLDTEVGPGGSLSLGERQIVAFARAVLRKPEILILDEATANIDTVTEKILEEIIGKLPKETTRVVIAHRLNTIANADDIFFVNGGEVKEAGSMEHAVELLLHGKRSS